MGFVKVGVQTEIRDDGGGGRDPETGISGWYAATTTTTYEIYAVYCDNCGSYNVREHHQGGVVYLPQTHDPYSYTIEKDARIGVPYEVRTPRAQCLVCGQIIRDDVIFVHIIQNEDPATNKHRSLKLEYRRKRLVKELAKRKPHSLLERLFPPRPHSETRTFFVQSDAEEFDYDYVIQVFGLETAQPHIGEGLNIGGKLLANPRHYTVASAENAPLKIRESINSTTYWESETKPLGIRLTGRY